MTLKVGVSSAWKSTASMKVGVGGAWKVALFAWVGVGGAWKQFYSTGPLALTVDDNTVSGACFGTTTCNAVSGHAVATASGGTGSYTFSWSKVSGDTLTVSDFDTATTSDATFSATDTVGGLGKSAVYRCTVNDGVDSDTVDVSITLSYFDDN